MLFAERGGERACALPVTSRVAMRARQLTPEGAGSIRCAQYDDGAKEKDEEDDAKDDVAKQSKRTDVSALVFDWNACARLAELFEMP